MAYPHVSVLPPGAKFIGLGSEGPIYQGTGGDYFILDAEAPLPAGSPRPNVNRATRQPRVHYPSADDLTFRPGFMPQADLPNYPQDMVWAADENFANGETTYGPPPPDGSPAPDGRAYIDPATALAALRLAAIGFAINPDAVAQAALNAAAVNMGLSVKG